jgi:hypothetical protein
VVVDKLGPVTLSRDNIRRDLIFEPRQLIAQQELSLLKPLQLQLISLSGASQRLDRRVEVAMLLAQPLELGDQPRAFLRRQPLLVHPCATLRQALHALNASVRPDVRFCCGVPVTRTTARFFCSGVVLSPQFNLLHPLFSQRMCEATHHPQKCRGVVQRINSVPAFSRLRPSQDMSQFGR